MNDPHFTRFDPARNTICLWRFLDWRQAAGVYPIALGRHRTCDSATPGNHGDIDALAAVAVKADDPAQRQAARRLIHKYLTPDDRTPRFPSVWLDDAAVNLNAVPLLKDVIDPGGLAAIYGPSGAGKSLFALDLAGRIAAGCGWRGRTGLSGLCVYVAAEAGVSILRRAVAWREATLGDAHQRIPLAIITRAVNLLDATEVDALVEDIRALTSECHNLPVLVIFDTLSRSMIGDENSAQDVNAVVAAADRIREALRCAVAFVHHCGKDTGKGMRGSSALFASCDSVLRVDDYCAVLEKSRDGVIGERFPFAIDSIELGTDVDGGKVTAAVIRATDTPAPRRTELKPKLTGAAQAALMALNEVIGDHGEPLPATGAIPAGTHGVTISTWKSRFRTRYADLEGGERGARATRAAFRRGVDALLAAHLVQICDPYAWAVK